MRLSPLFLAGVTILTLLSACAQPPPPAPANPAAATSTTGTPPPAPSSGGPIITAFHVIDDISCSGAQASVPVAWSTHDTQEVEFQVDRQRLNASYPLSGIGNIAVPCDGREHVIVLVAIGAGGRVSLARHVNTSNSPPPSNAPSITAFDLLDEVTCTGTTVEVAAGWATQNAQAVDFSVDGQPLPAAAGFPVTGAGNIPVPCDGNSHKVTLTATGTGTPASLSRSVNTSNSPPPPPVTGPVITAFQVIDDISCSDSQVPVPMSWTTRNAQTVNFQVDGQPVSAGAGYPVSGVGKVAVPCDGREHLVVLFASGQGGQVSLARHVEHLQQSTPSNAASISRFDVLHDVTCSADTVDVPADWVTKNARGGGRLRRRATVVSGGWLLGERSRQDRRAVRRKCPQGDVDGHRYGALGLAVAVGQHQHLLVEHHDRPHEVVRHRGAHAAWHNDHHRGVDVGETPTAVSLPGHRRAVRSLVAAGGVSGQGLTSRTWTRTCSAPSPSTA